MKKQIEKVLVIAPHPDDEINLAAQLIIELHKLKAEVYVLYTTNGDADFKIGNRRLGEAIRALSLIDIPEKNIIFLGYANDWKEGTHIFESNELVTSKLGKTKTNALKTHPEYCYRKYGKHHDFIYSNFKQDFKDVINELLPDFGYSSILNEREPFINASNLWQPDVNDSNKSIEIVFKEPRQIRYIKIYEDCNVQNHIKRMSISINKSDFEEYECSNNGTALTLDLEKNTAIKEIQIVIKEYEGIAGISEIELLPQEAYGNIFPFENYCSKAYMCSSKRWMTNIERIILNIWFLFTFKVMKFKNGKVKYVK